MSYLKNPILNAYGLTEVVEANHYSHITVSLNGRRIAMLTPHDDERHTHESVYHLNDLKNVVYGPCFSCAYGRNEPEIIYMRVAQFLAGARTLKKGEIYAYRDQARALTFTAWKRGGSLLVRGVPLN